jgi:hypothetical protein
MEVGSVKSSESFPAGLTLGVLLIVTALAGCSAGTTAASPAASSGPIASTVPSSTPAPSATPTPVAVPAGTVLTDVQIAALPTGITPYVMVDGSKVAVVKGELLPAPVLTDIQVVGLASVPAGTAPGGVKSTPATEAGFKAFLVKTSIELGGRQIVAVVHTSGYTESDTYTTGYYLPIFPGKNYPTVAEAVAVAMRYSESVGSANHPVVVFDFPF